MPYCAVAHGLALDERAGRADGRPGLETVGWLRAAILNGVRWSLVGLGGVWIEVLKDSGACCPRHVSHARGRPGNTQLKAARLLETFRGALGARRGGAWRDSRGQAGRLDALNPNLVEVDINPLVVMFEGEGVIALRCTFRQQR